MQSESGLVPQRLRRVSAWLVSFVLLGLGGVAVAHEVGDVVVISASVAEDVYAAGQSVDVSADVDGDVVVAGQVITLSGRVRGDVIAAGDSLTLAGDLQDDVRMAGRSLTLTGQVADHVVAAGQTVVLASRSHVGNYAWLAGNVVELGGEIDGDVVVVGETVSLSGVVGGDVELDAAHAVIRDSAHIHGDLLYPHGRVPEIESGARIDGRQIETAATRPDPTAGEIAVGIFMGVLFGTLSLIVLTSVLRVVTPPLMQGASAALRERPGRSVGTGVLALIVAPVVAIAAFVTVIGAPLGGVILLAYALLMVISVPVTIDALVDVLLRGAQRRGVVSRGWRFLVLSLTALAFVLVLQIPVLGVLVGLAAVLWGLGALVLRILRRESGLITFMKGSVPEPMQPDHTPAEPMSVEHRNTES